jgi:phosphatidylinositol-3-phosphatase
MRRFAMLMALLGLGCGLFACGTSAAAPDTPAVPESVATAAAAVKDIVSPAACSSPTPAKLPQHVFLIVLENEGYAATFDESAPPSYLKDLAKRNLLLSNYYGIGHNSLDNYIAMISGQAPNKLTQADCPVFIDILDPGEETRDQMKLKQFDLILHHHPDADLTAAEDNQQVGQGCIYPKGIKTVADQLSGSKPTWRAYMQSMSNPCQHPKLGDRDFRGNYVTRHNPFVYFRSIGESECKAHDVKLGEISGTGEGLINDLKNLNPFPNFVFISPDLCNDGHNPCTDKSDPRAQIKHIDDFLKLWIPKIQESEAYKDGMIIITFDEAEVRGLPKPGRDTDPIAYQKKVAETIAYNKEASKACCDEQPGPGTDDPGHFGPGGGRVGAVILSPFVTPGTNEHEFNHYSLLKSIEDLFSLDHLGFAKAKQLNTLQQCGVFNPNGPAAPSSGPSPGSQGS